MLFVSLVSFEIFKCYDNNLNLVDSHGNAVDKNVKCPPLNYSKVIWNNFGINLQLYIVL